MSATEPPTTSQRVTCRLCGALIIEGQTRCRICGSVYEAPRKSLEIGNKLQRFLDAFFPCIVLAVGAVAALMLCFYVMPARLAESPGTRLFTVLGLLFVATALLTMLDARQSTAADKADGDPLVAARWFGFTLVGWFAALPLYLQNRTGDGPETRRRNARAGVGVSAVVALLVIGCLGMMYYRHREYDREQLLIQAIVEKHQKKLQDTARGTRN